MSIKSQLEAIAKKRMQDVSDIARTSIIRVGNRIVTDSPVDKGSFINHWNTSINSIIRAVFVIMDGMDGGIMGKSALRLGNIPYLYNITVFVENHAGELDIRRLTEHRPRRNVAAAEKVLGQQAFSGCPLDFLQHQHTLSRGNPQLAGKAHQHRAGIEVGLHVKIQG